MSDDIEYDYVLWLMSNNINMPFGLKEWAADCHGYLKLDSALSLHYVTGAIEAIIATYQAGNIFLHSVDCTVTGSANQPPAVQVYMLRYIPIYAQSVQSILTESFNHGQI